jgi:chromosome partitioning protein
MIMTKIAFFNNKGGVGKSTSAVNVAHALARLGKRVVVVDCDTQLNTFTFFSDVAKEDFTHDQISTRYKNIDVAFMFAGVEQYTPDGYDYMVLDLPPALNERTTAIADSCDYVFVPIKLGSFAMQGLANVTEAIAPANAKFGGCFINEFDGKNSADRELEEMLRSALGDKVLKSRIPQSRIIKNSVNYRRTAFEHMPWLSPSKAYSELAQEIMAICGGS